MACASSDPNMSGTVIWTDDARADLTADRNRCSTANVQACMSADEGATPRHCRVSCMAVGGRQAGYRQPQQTGPPESGTYLLAC